MCSCVAVCRRLFGCASMSVCVSLSFQENFCVSFREIMTDQQLRLKPGFPVIPRQNIQPASGHVKGGRYVVEPMSTACCFSAR